MDLYFLYIYVYSLLRKYEIYKRCKKNVTDKFLENMHNNMVDIMHLINQLLLFLKVGIVFSMPCLVRRNVSDVKQCFLFIIYYLACSLGFSDNSHASP